MEAERHVPNGLSLAPSIQVTADDRESASAVVAELRQRPGVLVRVERLKLGDYVVDNDCVFERKTLADFAVSLVDGRLFTQARRLALSTSRRALILEGHLSELPTTGIRRESLLGAMVTLTLSYRVPILRAWDAAETAKLLLYAARQLERLTDDVPCFRGARPRQRRRRQLTVLQSLPGVGPKRAVWLLDHFQTVAAVASASEETLAALPGLGPSVARAIHDLLHLP